MDKASQLKRQALTRLKFTAQEAASAAIAALKSKHTEKRPGYCWRWVRQAMFDAGQDSKNFPAIPTARRAFAFYEQKGWAMPLGTTPKIGDILFKVGSNNGVYGHVGIMVKADVVAENSTAHIDDEDDQDARGVRTLAAFRGARVVRPPYAGGE